MSDPLTPNYKPGVGRLVTDRFDFQKHIDGQDFRHNADQINLTPPVTLGTPQTNVQSAIEQIKVILDGSIAPLIPDATTLQKGIVQLAGDIGGTATSVSVLALRGYPISATAPTIVGQVLTWNGSAWIPQSLSGAFTFAGDVTGNAGATTVVALNGKPIVATTPTTNQLLRWNGTAWAPATIIPTGTGFATLTGGNFDGAATANIRYTGGKFQTSISLQYLNGAVTGDLAWVPTGSNKILTLPNATDTLVGQSTTDNLVNKTISATDNTITDNSTVAGDILVSNGTKFVRRVQGSNGQFWGVSGGVAGYYTPSPFAVTGTGFITATSGTVDGAATANIRYTGGKFQTDANIQFKNASILGDLVWAPTGSNKTLTLPDISDILVSESSVNTFLNKTFDVAGTGNNLTSTSQAAGDLLKNNGTKFVRFARGSALQVLRTNAGGTDLEWATIAGITPEVTINQSGAGQLNNIVSDNGSGSNAAMIRFTGDGAATDITLSGIAGGTGVRRIVLAATSTSKLIVSHQDVNSSSTNRIICPRNTSFVVGTDGYSAEVMWDSSSSRWRLIAGLDQLF